MRISLLSWTLLTVVVYALGTNIDWALRTDASERSSAAGELRDRLSDPRTRQWLRYAFLLGFPAAALLLRVPRPSAIGLPSPAEGSSLAPWTWPAPGDQPWSLDLGRTLLLTILTAALLLAAYAWQAAAHGRRARAWPRRPSVASLGPAALESLALEAHWALLRAGFVSLGFENRSLAMFMALGLIGLEAWTSPWLRSQADDPSTLGRIGQTAVLGILSGLVFLETGSSLWALAAHLGVALCLLSLLPEAWQGPGSPSEADRASEPPGWAASGPELPEAVIPETRLGRPDIHPEPIEPTVV